MKQILSGSSKAFVQQLSDILQSVPISAVAPWTAYIGLGANLPGPAGPPETALRAAAGELAALGAVTGASSLWRSAPVGPVQDQPSFLNAALRLQTRLAPLALLQALLAVESRFGRTRSLPKGPRTLDLDLLLMERDGAPVVMDDPALTLPHPELHRRGFVLASLCEFAPELRHPTLGSTLGGLLRALPPGEAAEPVEPRLPLLRGCVRSHTTRKA